MKSLASYNHPGRDSRADRDSGGGGGDVEDILRRLGAVETSVSELKSQLSGILAILPHLATKADVADVRTDVADVRTDVANVKADVAQLRGEMGAGISGLETRIIKWIVATLLTSTGLAFTIAKFVH
jgi:hypothetical protein